MMKKISPENIVLITSVIFLATSLSLKITDIGFGIEGLRRWSSIAFMIAIGILSLPLLLLMVLLLIERLKPNKAEQDVDPNP